MTNYRILTTEYLTEPITDLINSKVRKGYNVTFSNAENFCRSGLIDNNPVSLVCCGTSFDWYNKPNEIGMKGWSIRSDDTYIPVDLDGDGYDEILVFSKDGNWIGILKYDILNHKFFANWIGKNWVNPPYNIGNNGWNLRPGDKFIPIKLDYYAYGKKSILVTNKQKNWIGILREFNGRLISWWMKSNWLNFKGQPENTGWRLRQNDSFYIANLDGDHMDEIIVISSDFNWIGILKYDPFSTKIHPIWIKQVWINTPGNEGTNIGWKLSRGDRLIPVDLNGDGRDEVLIFNERGKNLGILRYEQSTKGLVLERIEISWINPLGRSGECGWSIRPGDKFIPLNLDSRFPGKKEVLVSNLQGDWIGILRENDGKLISYGMSHNWINPPDETGNVGWSLRKNDLHISGDLNGDFIDEVFIASNDRQWVGIVKYNSQSDKLTINKMMRNWINPSQEGWRTRWRLNSGDKFFAGRFSNSNHESIFVVSYQSTGQKIRQSILHDLPDYLLIVGDCDQVPGYTLTRTYADSDAQKKTIYYASDFYYAMDDDDLTPKIPVGRLSSSNPMMLRQLINTLLSYPADHSEDWKKNVIFCGFLPNEDPNKDPDDPGWRCKKVNQNRLNYIFEYENDKEGSDKQKIIWGAKDSTKKSLINAINDGAALIIYFGHGSEQGWENIGDEKNNEIFTYYDVKNLKLGKWWEGSIIKENFKLPFIVSATCLTGNVEFIESFSEIWQTSGKCVGIFGADTLSSTFFNARIIPLIIEEVVIYGRRKIGDILLNAMKIFCERYRLYGDDFNSHTLKMYRYFGDPDTNLNITLIS